MEDNTPDAKERIMNTVVRLMLEGKDMSKVTNREIAALAGVNSALLNYYYQSKENLLNQAVGICMAEMTGELMGQITKDEAPVRRLKGFLYGISKFAVENRFLSELSITGELKNGNENTVGTILPILRELYGSGKTELELKLVALQIVVPLQVILLNRDAYRRNLGKDAVENWTQFLDILINNITAHIE